MKYFDLHCDTISLKSKKQNKTAVDLIKAECFEEYKQCYAIFVNDESSDEESFLKAKRLLDFYKENFSAFNNERCKSILTLENGRCIGDKISNIIFWAENKVKICSLTWNGKNSIGCGADDTAGEGLTSFGKNAVKELENNNIIVDVSHLNYKGFLDVEKIAGKPFVATHSNSYSICQHKRNLKDDQAREIIRRGGLIGICFYPLFLGKDDVFDLIYEHIYKFLELGGENSICFGSDFDGAIMDDKLNQIEKTSDLFCFLKKKGLNIELLNKIFFENAENFFNKCFT